MGQNLLIDQCLERLNAYAGVSRSRHASAAQHVIELMYRQVSFIDTSHHLAGGGRLVARGTRDHKDRDASGNKWQGAITHIVVGSRLTGAVCLLQTMCRLSVNGERYRHAVTGKLPFSWGAAGCVRNGSNRIYCDVPFIIFSDTLIRSNSIRISRVDLFGVASVTYPK